MEDSAESRRRQLYRLAARVLETDESAVSSISSPDNTPRWDSLAHVNLLLELEQGFPGELSARDLIGVRNIGDVEQLLGIAARIPEPPTSAPPLPLSVWVYAALMLTAVGTATVLVLWWSDDPWRTLTAWLT